MKKKKSRFKFRKIWRYRYRFYALVVLLLTLFVFRSDDPASVSILVPKDTLAFVIEDENLLAKKIVPPSEPDEAEIVKIVKRDKDNLYIDSNSEIVLEQERTVLYQNMGFVLSNPYLDMSLDSVDPVIIEKKEITLNDLIPIPSNPEKKGFISYPAQGINAPVVFANDEHLFNKNPDGTINYSKPIIEDPNAANRGDYTSTPVLKLLLDGAVHLGGAVSPQPGELGNAYIVGHSANYSSVISPYNYIFKSLKENPKSKVGETFYIYDQFGRKLKFRVFETKIIDYDDANEAYAYDGRFDERRVVTLQTCISHWVSGRGWIPDQRWLTRGELVLE